MTSHEKPLVICALEETSLATFRECDCACPVSIWRTISTDLHQRNLLALQARLDNSTYFAAVNREYHVGYSPSMPVMPVVMNSAAYELTQMFQSPRPISQVVDTYGHTDVIPSIAKLISSGLLQTERSVSTNAWHEYPTVLVAWLHVTNACNLRCTYCYVHKNGEAMDEATGRAALETIFRAASRGGFRAVKLKYAGGEPTLNFDLVRTLHEQAYLMAQRRELGLRETFITNGVALLDEILTFIGDAGMRLAISLDASRQAHDARRTLPDGGGTFAQVCHSIERAVRSGIHPHLSITLCGDRSEDSADAVALALELGLPFNLNFVRPARGPLAPTIGEGLITSVRAAFARIESRPPEYSILAILDRANFARPHRHACGAGRSYLAIDHRGRISPCQMELSQPTCDLTQEEPLAMLSSAFANPAVDERVECSACAWRYSCAGGCPWLTKQVYGHSRTPSPYCAVYRILYPELLRLEGIRLLQNQTDDTQ